MSLIPPDETFLLWGIIVGLAGFGFWAERETRIGKNATAIVTAMVVAMLLSNLRVIPFSSPVYDSIFANLLPVAMPLLLFRADLSKAFHSGGKTVLSFCIGAVGVLLGAVVAMAVIPLGNKEAVVAGLFTATYTGGSANLAAVAIAAEVNDGTLLTSIIAADVVASNIQTIFVIALPGLVFVRRYFGENEGTNTQVESVRAVQNEPSSNSFELAGATLAISIAMLLVYAGYSSAEFIGRRSLGIVFTTIYALLVSNFMKPVVQKMSCDFEIGLLTVFLFLVALAAGADVSGLLRTGVSFFFFAMILLVVHTIFLLIVTRIFGFDLRSVVIGSTACIGGVTTAAAISTAKGWRDLIVPGILAGTLGNALGTFLGVLVWSVLS